MHLLLTKSYLVGFNKIAHLLKYQTPKQSWFRKERSENIMHRKGKICTLEKGSQNGDREEK